MGTMKRTDLPAHAALQRAINDLDGLEMRAGWFEGAKYESGTPVAYVASIQEFGHGPIPPRPFMRSTQAERSEYWTQLVEAAMRGVAEGRRSAADVFELLGAQVAGDVRAKIASITEPPLSPLTIQARAHKAAGGTVTGKTLGQLSRKGPQQTGGVSTKPLVETRMMINTFTHQVEKK